MSHPCSSAKPPAWCTKKKRGKKRKGPAKTYTCPAGWERSGIMCSKGRQRKRATAKPKKRR